MNRILVPVSLSLDNENLLKYASSMARKGAKEIVFLVVRKPWMSGERGAVVDGAYAANVAGKPALVALLRSIEAATSGADASIKVKFGYGSFYSTIVAEAEAQEYNLMLLGAEGKGRWSRYRYRNFTSRLIGATKAPVFVVPPKTRFNEIQHITYAIDLSDYDPNVVTQVKAIAAMFDAKLTIAHVNVESEGAAKEAYVTMLDRMISSTLDYPKVHYRFFDHADPFGGIKKLVNLNDSHLLAMTNRTESSWRDRISPRSMTRKMAKELKLPLLAFKR